MKMNKRMLKVAVVSALTVACTVPAFANPFSDVPAKSWAYDAVTKLAQAGIIDGYSDGTFKGEKTVTRYEMAQMVAKAMTKSLNADQKATVDKLSKEFSAELTTMGVKVDGMQNQINDMVKITGDARLRYINGDLDGGSAYVNKFDSRVRLGATAKINDDMSLYARFTSGNMDPNTGNATASIDNAYVNIKGDGISSKIGRQDFVLGQGMLAGDGSVGFLNGVTVKAGNLMAFDGKEQVSGAIYGDSAAPAVFADSYGAQYSFNLLAPVTVDYLKQNGNEYAAASTSFNVVPGVKLAGEYAKNITAGADAYQVKASLGTTGLSVAYKDIKAGAVPFDSTQNLKIAGVDDFYAVSANGNEAKGMEYEYNKDVAKNTNFDVLYQNIKGQDTNLRATMSVKF